MEEEQMIAKPEQVIPPNGHMPDEACDEGPKEIAIPTEKAKLLTQAGDMVARAKMEVDLAQARLAATQNLYEANYFKVAAQLGANPDDFKLKVLDNNELVFVREKK